MTFVDSVEEVQSPTSSKNYWRIRDVKVSDEVITGELGGAIKECLSTKSDLKEIMAKYFDKENPFKANEEKGEFFSCGFLKNTNIYVLDSIVDDNMVVAKVRVKSFNEDKI